MGSYNEITNQIIYTASLATNKAEIDNYLDTLRGITSRSRPDQELDPEDKKALLNLQTQLENYLLTKEKVRFFTPESLKLQIELHNQGNYFKKSQIQLQIIIAISFSCSLALATLLPLQTGQQRGLVAGATACSLLTVGAATLFLTALKAFRSELRWAFLFICAGVTLLGISLLGQPIIEIFNLRQFPMISILFVLPVFIAACLFHTGNAIYARLVGVKNWWSGPMPILLAAPFVIVLIIFIPHFPTGEPEFVHDFVASLWGVMLLTPINSAIILAMALSKVSELYKQPINLLLQSMFPIIAVILYQLIVRLVVGPYLQGVLGYGLFLFVIFMGLGLIRAGYSFNKVSRY